MTQDLHEYYDSYERIEEAFQARLDESLRPRGPDFAYEVVASLGLPRGASVIDVGCGKGAHSIRLAQKFGFSVLGIDPIPRHINQSNEALISTPEVRELVRFQEGVAESIVVADASIDLILCREMLYHVDLDTAFTEYRRALRPGGRILIYQVFSTERLQPKEAEWFWSILASPTTVMNAEVNRIEAAFTAAGFELDQCNILDGEFGEYIEEREGVASRRLIHAARLIRQPARYIEQFGKANYDIMLGDCFWHVYRMIGKLSNRIYVLRKP